MAKLTFDVRAKYDEVIKLNQYLQILEEQMRNTSNAGDMEGLQKLQDQYAKLRKRMEDLVKGAAELNNAQRDTANGFDDLIGKAKSLGKELLAIGGVSLTINGLKNLATQVFNVKSQFEDAESTLQTFLGSESKGTEFFNQLKDYAYYNMFEFTDLLNASNQLIAYKNNVEDIIPTLDRLSNVASATHKPLMQYVEMWNRAKQIGFVDSRSQQSWGASGLVLNDILEEMGEKVENNKVTFEQLGRAIKYATDEGGQFAGIMDSQLNNLSAIKGQLEDDIASALNEIGDKTNGLLRGTVRFADAIVRNWEAVGKGIESAVILLGGYKATMLLVSAINKAHKRDMTIWAASLDVVQKKAAALKGTFATMGAAGWVGLAITAISTLLPWIIKTRENLGGVSKILKDLDGTVDDLDSSINSQKDRLKELNKGLQSAGKYTKEWLDLRDKAVQEFGQYYDNLEDEINRVGSLDNAYRSLSVSMEKSMRTRAYDKFIYGEDGNGGVAQKFMKRRDNAWERLAGTNISQEDMEALEELISADTIDQQKLDALRQRLGEYAPTEHTYEAMGSRLTAYSNDELAIAEEIIKNAQDFEDIKKRTRQKYRITEDTKTEPEGPAPNLQTVYNNAKSEYESSLKDYQKAQSEIRKGVYEGTTADFQQLADRLQAATKAYKEAGGDISGGRGGSGSKTDTTLNKFQQGIETFGNNMMAFVEQMQEGITQATIEAMADGDGRIEAAQEARLEKMMSAAKKAGGKMQELYNGNVDLLNRPQIDASELTKVGWEDAGTGTATVFSSLYTGVKDAKGKSHSVLITPILPDGSVLSEQELNDYIDNIVRGADDMLAADKLENGGKGLLIAVDSKDDGEQLHLMQEQYYDAIELVKAYNEALKETEEQQKRAARAAKDKEYLEGLVDQYKSLEDQKKDIEDEYLHDSIVLQDAYEKTGDEMYLRVLEARTKAYEEALDDMDEATDDTLKSIFGNIDYMTKSNLDKAIEYAKVKLKELYDEGDVSKISDMRSRLNQLESARDSYDFRGWGGSLTDVLGIRDRKGRAEDEKKLLTEQKTQMEANGQKGSEAYQNLSAALDEADNKINKLTEDEKKAASAFAASSLGGTLSKIGSALGEIAAASGDEGLGLAAEGFSEIGGAVSNIANGFATGGIFGGIAAAVGTVSDAVIDAIVSVKVADAEYKRLTDDFQHRLDMLKYNVEGFSNAFGDDSLGRARKAFQLATEAMDEFTAGAKDLKNINFKTKDYSWWVNLFGKGDEYESMSAFDVWGDDGLVDTKKMEAFLATWGSKLNDEQTQEIENVLALKEAYDEMQSTVEEYVTSLVGNTASDVAGEMLDKFLSTGNAIANMSDNLNDFKKKLAQSYTESVLMEKVFTKAKQDKITSALMNNNFDEAIDTYNKLLEESNAYAGTFQEFYEGINLKNDVSQDNTAGGFQTMSQDTGTELNGRFTALQISGENIDNKVGTLIANFEGFASRYASQFVAIDDIRNIQAQSLIELQGINENTLAALKPIRTMQSSLEEIQKKVERL